MPTKKELIKKALVRAGVVDIGQSPTGAQEAAVGDVLVSIHEEMVDRGYARWELLNIPDAIADPLVSALASRIADDFSVPTRLYERLKIAESGAIRSLIAYNEIPYTGQTVIESY